MICTALAVLAMAQPLKYRWFYLASNFFVPANVESAIALIHRAAKVGYNGLIFTDSKLESLNPYPDFYRKAIQKMLAAAASENMDVIPATLGVGYADSLLANDPSLVESMPCRHVEFKAAGGYLRSDDRELYDNGGFENSDGDKVAGTAYQDGIGKTSFVDRSVFHSGGQSLRLDNPGNLKEVDGNCRIVRKVALKPWHQYRLSVWVKTKDFARAGDVRAVALTEKGKSLSYGDLGVQPTQDWTQETVVFNSQDNDHLSIYLGVWGGTTGKLWFDDVSLKDAGLLNVGRRAACPLRVTGGSGQVYVEGQDFETAADPHFGNLPWAGEYDLKHEPPGIVLTKASRIREGSTVFLDYYAEMSTDQGKTSICLADPATPKLEKQEIDKIAELFRPKGFLLAQDEMRVQGWCGACEKSGKTPGRLIADDMKRSIGFLGGRQAFVWSDMFDPYHNAVDEYYLCHGSIKGSWEGLQPGTVVLNWNSGRAKESLAFFAGRGFHQILAGYYDSDPAAIKPWMEQARQAGGLDGVMYTTWVGNYRDLEAFAKAAWGG